MPVPRSDNLLKQVSWNPVVTRGTFVSSLSVHLSKTRREGRLRPPAWLRAAPAGTDDPAIRPKAWNHHQKRSGGPVPARTPAGYPADEEVGPQGEVASTRSSQRNLVWTSIKYVIESKRLMIAIIFRSLPTKRENDQAAPLAALGWRPRFIKRKS